MNLPFLRDRIRPSESVMACPSCQSTLPASGLEPLANFVPRDGRAHGIVTGHRVQCLQCGLIYGVGPNGAFRLLGERPPERATMSSEGEMPPDAPMRPLKPMARNPPRY